VRAKRNVFQWTMRGITFYAMTAAFIVIGIGVHEYSHYAAHEGFRVPPLEFHDGVEAAQADLLRTERSRVDGRDLLVHQPDKSTIVIYPNTFLQALGLGLLPAQAYADDGVLASTFFHLDARQIQELGAKGQMPAHVVASPIYVALGVFLVALAWALVRPNLVNKSLLVAYAVQLGDAGHHATAFGMQPEVFYGLAMTLVMVAAILVGLRMARRPFPKPVRPDMRPATRVVVRAPELFVAPRTHNLTTRRAAKS
jgi:hypothetical protein